MTGEFDRIAQELLAEVQLAVGAVEALGDPFAVDHEVVQLRPDAGLGEASVGRQVDEACLLIVDPGELLREGVAEEAGMLGVIGDRLVERAEQDCCVVSAELKRRVRLGDLLFDKRSTEVRQVTDAGLPTHTHEVREKGSPLASCLGVDEAVMALSLFAPIAEEHSFQVVVETAVSLSRLATGSHDVLDPLEQFGTDDRVVTTGQNLALEGVKSDVVRIAKHPHYLGVAQGLRCPALRSTRSQAEIFQGVREAFDGKVTACVQLECLAHQRRPHLVDGDRVDQPPIDLGANVQVTDRRPANGPATADLVFELDANVFSAHTDLDLIHDVRDAFHGVSPNAITEVFLGRHQLDAEKCQLAFGHARVDIVAEGPRAHINDHVVDFATVLCEVVEHLTEDGPLLDALRRRTRFKKLALDTSREGHRFARRVIALRRDRVAIRVDIDGGVHLTLARNAQIGDRACPGSELLRVAHVLAPTSSVDRRWYRAFWWLVWTPG